MKSVVPIHLAPHLRLSASCIRVPSPLPPHSSFLIPHSSFLSRWISIVGVAAALCCACAEPLIHSGEDVIGDGCVGSCGADTVADTTLSDTTTPPGDTTVCQPNGCGGCAVLPARPGDSCGRCGRFICEGTDMLNCEEDSGNACGGCDPLTAQPGDACGTCGSYACDGQNALTCNEAGNQNSCGGCDALPGVKDQSCGDCSRGTWTCLSPNSMVCQGDLMNDCGGCTTLTQRLGDSCGTCGGGRLECDGKDRLDCVGGSSTNECGGCATLSGHVGDPCGSCNSGTLQCNTDGTQLLCTNEVACASPCDPDNNGSLVTATHLGDFTDADNQWTLRPDGLRDIDDIDVFSVHADDTMWHTLDIIAELRKLSNDDDLCVFWERDDGEPTDVQCPDTELSEVGGLQGCCSWNSGTATEVVTLTDDASGMGDDSGTVYYYIITYSDTGTCHEYELAFAF